MEELTQLLFLKYIYIFGIFSLKKTSLQYKQKTGLPLNFGLFGACATSEETEHAQCSILQPPGKNKNTFCPIK